MGAMAMAEPEADAQLLYNHPYTYTHSGYYPYNFGQFGYSSYGYPATVYNSYGKREAEAEPEADPALIYTSAVHTHALPLHKPVVYNSALQTPLIYNSAIQAPLTYAVPRLYNTLTPPVLSKVFPSLKTLTTTPVVSHITKREAEAEADPALVYTTGVHTPLVYNTAVKTPLVYKTPVQTPLVYNTAVQTPVVYNTAVHTPLLKTVDNAVVPAVGGYIHSSHVGVCTNNLGVRVQC